MDYTTLVSSKGVNGSIKDWVNRSDIPSSVIVSEAEAALWEEVGFRCREMITTAIVTFTTTGYTQDLSTDFLDPVSFLPYEWCEPLPYVPPTLLRVERDSSGDPISGTPTKWAVIGNTMTVDYQPSETFAGELMFYARPTPLSAGNTTNFITNRYPTLFRHLLLSKAYSHMKDYERSQSELQVAEVMSERIKQRMDLALRGADFSD